VCAQKDVRQESSFHFGACGPGDGHVAAMCITYIKGESAREKEERETEPWQLYACV